MKLDVITLDGGKAGSIDLDDAIFSHEPRRDILHRMVVYQLAKRRSGNHKTKTRAEVKATSKKMYRQKGTGGARHGNKAAPQFRGGGVAHGPRVRSHAIDLPKKVRRMAMLHALSAKRAAGELIVLESATVAEGRTKELVAAFGKLGWSNALIVDGTVDEKFGRAARNIPNVDVLPVVGANVYDILRRRKLVLTRAAVEGLKERLK
ncbi:MAG: 50S ribosomal protein L4 [Parvularculaceae bacterium]|nr:50S ribosomal protein L4 [Parvularculaceae bacterium]